MSRSDKDHASDANIMDEREANIEYSDRVLTFGIHEKSSLETASGRQSSNKEVDASEYTELHEVPQNCDHEEVLMEGNIGSPESRRKNVAEKHGGKGSSIHVGNRPFGFGPRSQDSSFQKVMHFLLLNSFDCVLHLSVVMND